MSRLYMQAAHEEGHEGAVSTLHRLPKINVDNRWAIASRGSEGVLHGMSAEREEMHGAEDGATP